MFIYMISFKTNSAYQEICYHIFVSSWGAKEQLICFKTMFDNTLLSYITDCKVTYRIY